MFTFIFLASLHRFQVVFACGAVMPFFPSIVAERPITFDTKPDGSSAIMWMTNAAPSHGRLLGKMREAWGQIDLRFRRPHDALRAASLLDLANEKLATLQATFKL